MSDVLAYLERYPLLAALVGVVLLALVAYLAGYLRQHPKIHQDMTLLVRQLEPGAGGLPIEIYTFTNITEWGAYEDIQSDVFDHVLSIIHEFGLRVFQEPAGADLAGLTGRVHGAS
jgi:miniconductance mechanosensitive channel